MFCWTKELHTNIAENETVSFQHYPIIPLSLKFFDKFSHYTYHSIEFYHLTFGRNINNFVKILGQDDVATLE